MFKRSVSINSINFKLQDEELKLCTTIPTAFSHFVDIAKFVLGHLVVQMIPHSLLGLLCELELGPGRPLLGKLVDLCVQVLLLHQVDSIPDDTQNKSKIL